MNKVVSYLGGGVYAESMPELGEAKLYVDVGAAQDCIIFLDNVQIDALKKFLAQIEEGCE